MRQKHHDHLPHLTMKDETKTAITCTTYLVIFLIYINCAFYSIYTLPFGMIDIDGYLYHNGDPDPRLQNINNGIRLKITGEYIIFYKTLETLGNPRITFLWLPPLLIGLLILQVYWIYDHLGGKALRHTLMFVCMTYAIPFFFIAALYRQLMGMVILLIGYNLLIRNRKILGGLLVIVGVITHIHLAPIAAIYVLADRVHKRKWLHTAVLVAAGTVIALKTQMIMAIGPLLPSPQPTLYTILFTLTNPILVIYAFKRLNWDFKHILLVMLLITMPFTDQSRGMIFLQILLVPMAYTEFTRKHTPTHYKILILILSCLWFSNIINFLIHSMAKDSIERNLDLRPMIEYLQTHTLNL